jgi:hypothetical protein
MKDVAFNVKKMWNEPRQTVAVGRNNICDGDVDESGSSHDPRDDSARATVWLSPQPSIHLIS